MIEVGKEYYVVSNAYHWIDAMEKVIVEIMTTTGPFVVVKSEDDGEWITAGYIDENDLLSADEIIKVWQHHRMMADSFERHG